MNLLSLGASLLDICTNSDTKSMIVFIGQALTIVKVAIPVLIIALGIFDFGKAVVAQKEDEIKNKTKRLIYRIIAGVVIYFIPAIILTVFGAVQPYNDNTEKEQFKGCQNCLLNPGDC